MALMDIRAWEISCTDASAESRDFRESIFSQGNGYMGVRGFRPDAHGLHPAHRSTFYAGFFEYIRPGITDMVNQPDTMHTELLIDGADADALTILDYRQSLSLRDGLLTWHYTLLDGRGRRMRVEIERLIDMADLHTAALRYTICPLDSETVVTLRTGIDGSVENLPISDNQMQDDTAFLRLLRVEQAQAGCDGGYLLATTRTSRRASVACYRVMDDRGAKRQGHRDGNRVYTQLEVSLPVGAAWRVEKTIAVACYRDGGDPYALATSRLRDCTGFDAMHTRSAAAWEALWAKADVQVEGNELWQGAVRYNIFQLIQSTPRTDEHASIGARGLMHGRYKGCYFWDTEVFMLPLFLYTMPEVAKNLLLYRYHTLEDAKESARRFSVRGARYPWMASDTGFEQCETWDTGCCEVHITADIAYAMGRYVEVTGDTDFLFRYAVEVYVETARYWQDRFNYCVEDGQYHLLFVKGPDEYCGVTTNDFFTVYLARHNLLLALDAVQRLRREAPERYAALVKKTGLTDAEMAIWKRMAEHMVLHQDERTKVWQQDDTFARLEPVDVAAYKDSDEPLYCKLSFDRLQRLQVLKQPAVLMCMAMFPEAFSYEEIDAAWRYYEPKTLHDSTLSFGIHALIAARLDRQEEALRYFEKAVLLDLRDVMRNTGREGVHLAALGAAWQALVLGFGGVRVGAGGVVVQSHLPKTIDSLSFRLQANQKTYSAHVSANAAVQLRQQ